MTHDLDGAKIRSVYCDFRSLAVPIPFSFGETLSRIYREESWPVDNHLHGKTTVDFDTTYMSPCNKRDTAVQIAGFL